MQIEVHGKNLPVTDALRSYAVKKLGRLDRYLSPECSVDVELAVERNPRIADSQIAEGTVSTRGETLRARAAADDMYAAVDALVDRLRHQAATYHDKRGHGRPHHAVKPASLIGTPPDAPAALLETQGLPYLPDESLPDQATVTG